MEEKLLLLGLLRTHDMYGYQLNHVIDMHLGLSVHLTKPTAYRLLSNMADDGWISFTEEREGKRPPRRVYSITEDGESAFQQLLKESLANYKPVPFTSNISLAFLDTLPAEEVLSLLNKRRVVIQDLIETVSKPEEHHDSFYFIIELYLRHLQVELEWLDKLIDQIKSSKPFKEGIE